MAGLLDQYLGNPEGGSGLLGNSAFRLGLGLLQASQDRRINPITSGLQGLLGAQQFRGDYADQQYKIHQQQAEQALQKTMGGLLDPTDPTQQLFRPQAQNVTDPSTGLLGPPTPQPGPGSVLDPQSRKVLGALSTADPKTAATLYASMYGDATRPLGHQPGPRQNYVGAGVMLQAKDGSIHAGVQHVKSDGGIELLDASTGLPTDLPIVNPATVNYQPGTGIPVQTDRFGHVKVLQSAEDVQNLLNTQADVKQQADVARKMPSFENRIDQEGAVLQWLKGSPVKPGQLGLWDKLPTLLPSSAGWQARQAQLNSMGWIDQIEQLRATSPSGASGLGGTSDTEGNRLSAAAQTMANAQTKEQWDAAAEDYGYALRRIRAIERVRAGKPEDYTGWTAGKLIPQTEATRPGGPLAQPDPNKAGGILNVPPAAAPANESYEEMRARLLGPFP